MKIAKFKFLSGWASLRAFWTPLKLSTDEKCECECLCVYECVCV